MTMTKLGPLVLLGVGSCAAMTQTAWAGNGLPSDRIVVAQADDAAATLDKLRQQPPVDVRQKATVPSANPSVGGAPPGGPDLPPIDPQQQDKMMRVQKLIEDFEGSRGAAPGTIKVAPAGNGGLELRLDLFKARNNFFAMGKSPFATTSSLPDIPNVNAIVTPADLEYRMTGGADGGEQVVGVKAGDDIAANAFKSGNEPVTLHVDTANLTAQQVAGPDKQLAVNVQANGESRQMQSGDVAKFGTTEVTVLSSANYSGVKSAEGPPYSLRLKIRTVP